MTKPTLVVFLVFLCVAFASAQSCRTVRCGERPECLDTDNCPTYDVEEFEGIVGCCPQCCDTSCVNCLVDPCQDYECASDPDLQCNSNYCGGCNRLWYSEERTGFVACEREARVPHEEPTKPFTCDNVLCARPECEEVGGCLTFDVQDDGAAACCPQCCEESCVNCLVDPCQGYECAEDRSLRCTSDYCGGCNRLWYSDERSGYVSCGREVQEEKEDPEEEQRTCATVLCAERKECEHCETFDVSEDGQLVCCAQCCDDPCVDCFADPCQGYECSSQPGLECRADYCGGCNRLWYSTERFGFVHCEREDKNDGIPVDDQQTDCALVDCARPECKEVGECYSYSIQDGETACCPQCCEEPCVNCLVDPCDGYECVEDPSLRCESNYCGGCNRLWFSEEFSGFVSCGREARTIPPSPPTEPTPITCANVRCAQPVCEHESNCYHYDLTQVGDQAACCPQCCEEPCANCLVDPCDGFECSSNLNLRCEANYCGGCNRLWLSDEFSGYVRCERESSMATLTDPNSPAVIPIGSSTVTIPAGAFQTGTRIRTATVTSTELRDTLPAATNAIPRASEVLRIDAISSSNDAQQPAEAVAICFDAATLAFSTERLCLAFINSNEKWECQDFDLMVEDNQLCGTTNHFTLFAVMDSNDVSKQDPTRAPIQTVASASTDSNSPLVQDRTASSPSGTSDSGKEQTNSALAVQVTLVLVVFVLMAL